MPLKREKEARQPYISMGVNLDLIILLSVFYNNLLLTQIVLFLNFD